MSLPRFRSSRLWIAPLVGIGVAAVFAAAALFVDAQFDWDGDPPPPLFGGSPSTARTLLSVIATATTTLLALVFTILAVVIQLGSSQYSPRVLRTMFQDFPSHLTIGVFVATIAYALVVLLALGPGEEDAHGVATTLAFGMAVIAVVTFAIYANHIVHSVRIASIINRVAIETRGVIDAVFPDPVGTSAPAPPKLSTPSTTVPSSRWGVIVDIDDSGLVEAAAAEDVVISLTAGIGEQVHEGAPLIAIYRDWSGEAESLRDHIELAGERQLNRDAGWGFRILTDIATRAVSTGINDATTATQALDRSHALLRVLAHRSLAVGVLTDDEGDVRVIIPTPDWEYFVSLTTDELRRDGASSIQVMRRLRELLVDLLSIAPEERKPTLSRRLELLEREATDEIDEEHDRELTERIAVPERDSGLRVTDRRSAGA
jgi:uncharacterized membrane protein